VSESQGLGVERAVGRNLRALRNARGWPLRETAERMKAFGYTWHQTVVAKIETGDRPLRLGEAIDLASLYGANLGDLFGELHPDITLTGAELDARIEIARARAGEAGARYAAVQSAADSADRAAGVAQAELTRAREELLVAEMKLGALEMRREMR
jgi:transcriptional regulator with XRE-family HTH domain